MKLTQWYMIISILLMITVFANPVNAEMIWVNAETNYSANESIQWCWVDNGADENYLTSAGGDNRCEWFWITEEYEELGQNTTRIGWQTTGLIYRSNTSESNDTNLVSSIWDYESSSWVVICNLTFGDGATYNDTTPVHANCKDWFNDTHTENFWATNRRLRINSTGYSSPSDDGVMKYVEGVAGYNSSGALFYCDAGDIALNFTAYDEKTLDQLYFDMDILINYSVGASEFNFSHEYSGNNTYYVCYDDLIGQDIVINDAEIRYENTTSYSTRYYYLGSSTVDNVTDDVHLYLLDNSSSTLITKRTLNQAESEEENVIIQSLRYDIGKGTYTLVAQTRSDFSGYAYTYLELYETYRFILIRDGVVLREYTPMQIATNSLIFYISITELPEYFDYYDQVSSSCSYDNSTSLLSCSYVDASGLNMNMDFLVQRLEQVGLTNVCNQSLSTSSGNFNCNLTGTYTYKYSMKGTYNPYYETYIWQQGFISVGSSVATFGAVGLVFAFLLITFSAFLSYYSIRASLIATGFSFIFSIASNLIQAGVETFAMMITVALIVMIVAVKVKG